MHTSFVVFTCTHKQMFQICVIQDSAKLYNTRRVSKAEHYRVIKRNWKQIIIHPNLLHLPSPPCLHQICLLRQAIIYIILNEACLLCLWTRIFLPLF